MSLDIINWVIIYCAIPFLLGSLVGMGAVEVVFRWWKK